MINQTNKHHVWNYWQSMGQTFDGSASAETLSQFMQPNVEWHGFEPLRRLNGTSEIWSAFWQPLKDAIPDLMRRPYHFIGGNYANDRFGTAGDWVCGTGDFIGTFANDWELGDIVVPASGNTVHFRFGEFCKIGKGKISQIRIIIDLPDLLRQSGITLFPSSYGRDIWPPGPLAGDGICLEEQDPAETQQTFDLVTEMIFGGLNKYDGKSQESQGLEQFWHPHMVWHGPVGIGSAYGMGEFKQNAQGPIVNAFPDRRGVGHQARIADGKFAASTGWPSLGGTHQRKFMDWEPTGERIGWNIMDFWKRDGDKLLENWVMIDLIGAAKSSGVDLLNKLKD